VFKKIGLARGKERFGYVKITGDRSIRISPSLSDRSCLRPKGFHQGRRKGGKNEKLGEGKEE